VKSYHKAIKYGFRIHGARVKDCLHDAYLRHYNKTGKCLLGEPIGLILHWMKNEGKIYHRKQCYEHKRELYQRQFVSVGENEGEISIRDRSPDALMELQSKDGVRDFYGNLDKYESNATRSDGITSDTLRIQVDLLLQGYKKVEIAEIMDVSPQVINYRNKLIKGIYEEAS
jgi:hypothetical protein